MVRVIYITSQKHFIPPNRIISNINYYGNSSKFEINNKYNKFDYCFDDWNTGITQLLCSTDKTKSPHSKILTKNRNKDRQKKNAF